MAKPQYSYGGHLASKKECTAARRLAGAEPGVHEIFVEHDGTRPTASRKPNGLDRSRKSGDSSSWAGASHASRFKACPPNCGGRVDSEVGGAGYGARMCSNRRTATDQGCAANDSRTTLFGPTSQSEMMTMCSMPI